MKIMASSPMDFCGKASWLVLISLLTCFHGTVQTTESLTNSYRIQFQVLSYTNFNGSLSSGDCCSGQGKSPNCPWDSVCNLLLEACNNNVNSCRKLFNGTFIIDHHWELDPGVDEAITGNKSVVYEIVAWHDNIYRSALISSFDLTFNLKEPFYPYGRTIVLKNNVSEIQVRTFFTCSDYYYGPTCSKYCKATRLDRDQFTEVVGDSDYEYDDGDRSGDDDAIQGRYTCTEDGDKLCDLDWSGPECNQKLDFCVGNLCHPDSRCISGHEYEQVLRASNRFSAALTGSQPDRNERWKRKAQNPNYPKGYFCVCSVLYTGRYCNISRIAFVPSNTTTEPTSEQHEHPPITNNQIVQEDLDCLCDVIKIGIGTLAGLVVLIIGACVGLKCHERKHSARFCDVKRVSPAPAKDKLHLEDCA